MCRIIKIVFALAITLQISIAHSADINSPHKLMPPDTDFSFNSSDLTVNFSDSTSSTTAISGHFWDFGDGNTSTQQNPQHVYAVQGTYTVCLTTTNMSGSDSACKSVIIVCSAPNVDFTTSISDKVVDFGDSTASISNVSFVLWDFGDGNTSTQSHPVHTYNSYGLYTVCLTVVNGCQTDSTCKSVNLVCPKAKPKIQSIVSDRTVVFSDTANHIQPVLSSFWDFGDGNTSTLPSVQHTYASDGSYTVCLTATNSCGTDSTCKVVTVSCDAITANFGYEIMNRTLRLYDSTNFTFAQQSKLWDFGDSNTSTQQNPVHNYSNDSTYKVCLISSTSCAADTFCQMINITCDLPQAGFIDSINGRTVTFFDTTLTNNPIAAWMWEFGDNGISFQTSPSHTYSTDGVYLVCLTVVDVCGNDSVCKSVVITSTGINEASSNLELMLYPNPTQGIVNIQGLPSNASCKLEVFSLDGRLMLSKFSKFRTTESLNLEQYRSGLFHLRVSKDNQTIGNAMIMR